MATSTRPETRSGTRPDGRPERPGDYPVFAAGLVLSLVLVMASGAWLAVPWALAGGDTGSAVLFGAGAFAVLIAPWAGMWAWTRERAWMMRSLRVAPLFAGLLVWAAVAGT